MTVAKIITSNTKPSRKRTHFQMNVGLRVSRSTLLSKIQQNFLNINPLLQGKNYFYHFDTDILTLRFGPQTPKS